MWMPEDRKRVCEHKLSDTEATQYFKKLANQCKDFAWVVKSLRTYEEKGSLPKKMENKSKSQITGMCNNLGTFDLTPYVPTYDEATVKRKSAVPLWDVLEAKKNELKTLIVNNNRQR